MIYVISHKCPDTDSIIASIIYARYLANLGQKAKPIRLDKVNAETEFVLGKFGIEVPELIASLPEWSQIALVDHNELSQSIDHRDKYEIVAVVDHHKFKDFSTEKYLSIRTERLWSTNSILYKMFKEAGMPIDNQTGWLMASAIISDTMYFRAPTTSEEDKRIFWELLSIIEMPDPEVYSIEMFNAKSNLWNISAIDLIKTDYKEFKFWSLTIWIWVLETTNPNYALWRQREIIEAMGVMRESGLDFVMLSIVDIFKQVNTTIIPSEYEAEIIEKVFGFKANWYIVDMQGLVSRKLDIIPKLTKHFDKVVK